MAYQPGIPTGTVPLNQDYVNIQNNFNELNNQFLVDHVPLTETSMSPPNGFHTDIHLVTQSGDPSSSSAAQLYSRVASIPSGGDTQLFYKSVMDTGTAQISGNHGANNGFGWFSGILIQWGQLTSTSNTFQTLLFSPAFPTNCFAIFTQPYGSSSVPGSQATVEIRKSTISKTSFEWVFVTNSADYTGFFWVAIGN
jgi:hypothetical protein